MARGLVVGLVLGVALGWLLFHAPDAPRAALPDEEPASGEPTPSRAAQEAPSAPSLAGSPPSTPVAEPAPEEAVALEQRLTVARATRDFPAFLAALEALGAADTPEADRVLVQVLGDDTLDFPTDLAPRFVEWLEDSEAAGIAEAARTRQARSAPLRHNTMPYLRLLGRYGDLEDLARARLEFPPHLAVEVMRGMAASPDAHVRAGIVAELEDLEAFRRETRTLGAWPRIAETLARAYPDEGVPLLFDALDRALEGGPGTTFSPAALLNAAYQALAPDCLEELRDHLAAVETPDRPHRRRLILRYACVIGEQGVDITSLRHLIEQPTVVLGRIVTQGGPESEEAQEAMHEALQSIQQLQALQTGRNLDLVEQTLSTLTEEARKRYARLEKELPAMRVRAGWERR